MLDGRVAWVTGASGGLGTEVARALAGAGAAVVASARDAGDLETLRATLGVPVERWQSAPVDLVDAGAALAAAHAAVARFGRLDILVAAAGGWRGGKNVADTDSAVLDWLWQTNLVTAFNACRAALPHMTAAGWGRIITIAARGAVSGQARSGAYAASKAALVALTQSIAAETKQAGVTANALLLSTVDTPANRAASPDADASRWVAPEQIAAAVRFLCTDEASAISGAAIPVFGRA